MSTAEITKRIAEVSSRRQDALVGFYYLLTILTGVFVLFFHGRRAWAGDLIASVFYIVITAALCRLGQTSDSG